MTFEKIAEMSIQPSSFDYYNLPNVPTTKVPSNMISRVKKLDLAETLLKNN